MWRAGYRFCLVCPLALTLLAGGCVTDPYAAISTDPAYTSAIATGAPFLHRVIANNRPGDELHVYIEGDGRPWLTPTRKSADPTSREPIALQLFVLDPGPAIYLGRPCYLRLADPHCEDDGWWTERRYAPEVIASMNAVLDQYAHKHARTTLLGYSGGGTVAWLMAGGRADTGQVVTIAANLDVDAWARLHGWSPLTGSLDPAQMAPLPARIAQLHLTAGQDTVVPAASVATMLARQPDASHEQHFEAFDHRCCWRDIWPDILAALAAGH